MMSITIGNGGEVDGSKTSAADNAVSREIAKLLLNLHASGTAAPVSSEIAAFGTSSIATNLSNTESDHTQKAEDLSVKITRNGTSSNSSKSHPHFQTDINMALDLTSNSSSAHSSSGTGTTAKTISLTSSDSPYSAPLPAS